MKLTWFGGATFRIHTGGRIVVVGAEAVADGIDARELRSGADMEIAGAEVGELPPLEVGWQPRRPATLLDAGEDGDLLVRRVGHHAVLIHGLGEPPLLLVEGAAEPQGRWTRDAVVVVHGSPADAEAIAGDMLDELAPRLLALAIAGPALDGVVEALRDRLGGTALVALEPGQALEV